MTRSRKIATAGAFAKSAAFLSGLRITVEHDQAAKGVLPNVAIIHGRLLVASHDDDLASNLLHEAGHLAVIPSVFRAKASGDLSNLGPVFDDWLRDHPAALAYPEDPIARGILQSGECEAVAWSYAAAHTMDIDTRIPFCRGFAGEGMLSPGKAALTVAA